MNLVGMEDIQSVGLRETYATLICSSPGSGLGKEMLYSAGARRKRVMRAFILVVGNAVVVALQEDVEGRFWQRDWSIELENCRGL